MNSPLSSYRAQLTPEMDQLLGQPADLFRLIDTEERALAISLPNAVIAASKTFTAIFSDYGVEGRVFLAHKTTNSPSLISAVRGQNSVDVASEAELESALLAGFTGTNILATGPKSQRFLSRLLDVTNVTIAVDSLSELKRLTLLMSATQPSIALLLRLSRSLLNQPTITKVSRFGLDRTSFESAISVVAQTPQINLRGVSFHLDSQSHEEKAYASERAMMILLELQSRGFDGATVIDCGGGFGSHFGLNQADYQSFEDSLKAEILARRAPATWQNHHYGLQLDEDGTRIGGTIHGVSLPRPVTGADALSALLAHRFESGSSFANELSDNLIELWIEPGAALCADGGVVVTEVIERRQSDGHEMIVVDAHRNQICFENNEFLADPIHLPRSRGQPSDYSAFVVGHLCMESDFMTQRLLHFTQPPEPGDLLVWTHTGAYRSHFSASQSIGHPLAATYTFDAATHQLHKDTLKKDQL